MRLQSSLLMLDPDVLRSFVAIAETRQFFTAALHGIYRNAVSRLDCRIKRLEEQLGVSVSARCAECVAERATGRFCLAMRGG